MACPWLATTGAQYSAEVISVPVRMVAGLFVLDGGIERVLRCPAQVAGPAVLGVEVLGLAVVLSLFVGGGVLFSTRNLTLSLIFFGVAFVASVLVFATLLLAISKPEVPSRDEDAGASGH